MITQKKAADNKRDPKASVTQTPKNVLDVKIDISSQFPIKSESEPNPYVVDYVRLSRPYLIIVGERYNKDGIQVAYYLEETQEDPKTKK